MLATALAAVGPRRRDRRTTAARSRSAPASRRAASIRRSAPTPRSEDAPGLLPAAVHVCEQPRHHRARPDPRRGAPDGLDRQADIHDPLRHGILFNDGTPFNAQAVVFSFQRYTTYPGSARASDYAASTASTAAGKYTVVYPPELNFSPALHRRTDGVVLSPTEITKHGLELRHQDPIGVGPFMVDHRVARRPT